jgi:hypothetical protein
LEAAWASHWNWTEKIGSDLKSSPAILKRQLNECESLIFGRIELGIP